MYSMYSEKELYHGRKKKHFVFNLVCAWQWNGRKHVYFKWKLVKSVYFKL